MSPSNPPTPLPTASAAPADFSGSSYELTFTPENADQDLCVTIYIADDDIYELTERFVAVLTTNDSCVKFKQEFLPVEILDDDCELCRVYTGYVCVAVKVMQWIHVTSTN